MTNAILDPANESLASANKDWLLWQNVPQTDVTYYQLHQQNAASDIVCYITAILSNTCPPNANGVETASMEFKHKYPFALCYHTSCTA